MKTNLQRGFTLVEMIVVIAIIAIIAAVAIPNIWPSPPPPTETKTIKVLGYVETHRYNSDVGLVTKDGIVYAPKGYIPELGEVTVQISGDEIVPPKPAESPPK
jgi:prepilin-type N-terminal cleavage/methylation domain-containing protein